MFVFPNDIYAYLLKVLWRIIAFAIVEYQTEVTKKKDFELQDISEKSFHFYESPSTFTYESISTFVALFN